jgi:hypothetical protein
MKSAPDERMSLLASGIHNALTGLYEGATFEFVLVVALPANQDEVTLSTITGITNADHLRTIAIHLNAMADAQDPFRSTRSTTTT